MIIIVKDNLNEWVDCSFRKFVGLFFVYSIVFFTIVLALFCN